MAVRKATTALPLHLAGSYTLLALYGSLYPFRDWRDSGVNPLDFINFTWPRYFTSFDLLVNTLAYLPLGLLWVTALLPRLGNAGALLAAFSIGTLLSLGIETLQNYLPSRVPSSLDWACNALGCFIGASAGLRWGHNLLDGGRLHAWRMRRFLHGPGGDYGLLLIAFWFLTQLNPETFLFGNGNLRSLLGMPAALDFSAGRFIELETLTVAAETLAVALIGSRLALNHPVALPLTLIMFAVLVKSFAIMLLMQSVHGFAWATPGTLIGLVLGIAAWRGALSFSVGVRLGLTALALMLAAVLANLIPDNPYLENTLRVWQQGHFLNFNGLTRLTSSLWPFFALLWLTLSLNRK